MSKTLTRTAVAVAALFATPVVAEEATSNYNGFYAGALAGQTSATTTYDMQGYRIYNSAQALSISPPRWPIASYTFEQSQAADGMQGGIVLGYNWDVGAPQGWVLGAELDHFFGDVRSDNFGMQKYVADIGQRSFSLGSMTTARMRVGYDMNGFMPYAAAGGACADVSVTSVQWMAKPYHSSGTQCGLSVAVGAEYKFDNGFSVRLEQRSTQLSDVQVDQTILGGVMHF